LDAGAPLLRNWGANPGQFNLAYTGTEPSNIQAQVRIGPNTVTAAAPAADVTTTEWNHVAMTANGARLTLYVNGEAAASTDYIGSFNSPPMPWLAFGTEMDDTGVPTAATKLFGALDDVGLWTRALSADEVAAIYQAGLQGKDLSTVEIVIPEEPEIAIEVDGSGNAVINFIGTLIHSPTVNGPYTPVDGATSPYTTSEPGFYQTME
ncbi:MAG: LamG domain-containing protein, partial [Verrucomicrobiales bacterium]|nr:LamG domain-containing protein [Verrucomicrobiales bacterium]